MQVVPEVRVGEASMDVFAAARWLDRVDNGVARAVSLETVEWKCRTWGSGEGCAYSWDYALFSLVAAVFDLSTSCDCEGRDELLVEVPLSRFADVAELVERVGDEFDGSWPWLGMDAEGRELEATAEFLGMSVAELRGNPDLLFVLDLNDC